MTAETTSPAAYWDALNRHDWFYDYSDDPGVWRRGADEHRRLSGLAGSSEAHQALWDGFVNHVKRGGQPGGAYPKPERPEK